MRITPSAGDRLAAFTRELSQASDLAEPKVVRSELATVFEHGVLHDVSTVPAADLPTIRRRKRILTTLSGVLATITGKVVLGTAVAAASVGAAHAAGVVDVPGLPDTTPAVETPDVEVPAPDEAGNGRPDSDGGPPGTTGAPDSPGVDGDEVSDRATNGEPQEDGKEFGTSIADEATEGTPAESKAGGAKDTAGGADGGKPGTTSDDTPGGGDTADDHKPDSTPNPPAPANRP
jgi:hypothetical protein